MAETNKSITYSKGLGNPAPFYLHNAIMHISTVDLRVKIAIIYGFERSPMKFDPKFIEKIINHYHCDKTNLLAILADIQAKYNWLPPQALKLVAEKIKVPMIDVYGVASFYHAFSLTPRGRHIVTVCQGTACHVRGAPILLDRIQKKLGVEPGCTTKDDQFTLETVNCLGACALAPIVVIDGNYHGKTTVQKADSIIDDYSRTKSRKIKQKKKIKKTVKKKRKPKKKTIKKRRSSKRQVKKKKKILKKIRKKTNIRKRSIRKQGGKATKKTKNVQKTRKKTGKRIIKKRIKKRTQKKNIKKRK